MKWSSLTFTFGISISTAVLAAFAALAEGPEWRIIKRSNTGIPGVEVHFARFDPRGRLWVSARDWFWGEGGVAVYDGQRWTAYSNLDTPMPSQWVYSIAFDESGAAWIGTGSGLARFDGVSWLIYDRANSPLPGNEISSLRFDSLGRLWMVYGQTGEGIGGVARLDGTDWTIWSKEEIGDRAVAYGGLALALDNNVWLGTRYSGGIARFDGSKWTVYDASNGYSDYPAEVVTLGRDGHIWADWDGIKMYDGTEWIPQSDLPGNHDYSALFVDSDGTYWVGTYDGVLGYYNGSAWSQYSYGNHLYSIDKDSRGHIWCAGLAFVRRFNEDLSWTTYSPFNTGLPDNFLSGVGFDTDGRAWIAGTGVASFDGAIWRCFNPYNDGFEPWPFSTDLAEGALGARDGTVWVAPSGTGIAARWDGLEWTRYDLGYLLEFFTEDENNDVWAGGPFGIARFDGTGFVIHRCQFEVNDIDADASGDIWAATQGGLARFDGAGWTFYNTSNSEMPSNIVQAVAVGPAEDVWAGTTEGLAHFDGTNWAVYTESNSGLPADIVWAVDVRADGLLAVGAFDGQDWPYHGGVALYDGVAWRTYTTENSPLRHEQVETVEFAPTGDLWLTSAAEGVAVILLGTSSSVGQVERSRQEEVRVLPNPFRDETVIRFTLPRSSRAVLRVFDASGRIVSTPLDQVLGPRSYEIRFDGRELNNALYFYQLQADGFSSSGRMLRVR